MSRLLIAISITALLAAGESLVIITRNIDLSVGATVGVAAYLTAELLADHRGLPAVVAVAVAVAIGAGARSGQRGAGRRCQGAVDHRHPRHAVDLPQRADQPRRRETIATGALPAWLVDLPRSTVVHASVGYEVRTMFVLAVVIVVAAPPHAAVHASRPAPVRARLEPRRRPPGRAQRRAACRSPRSSACGALAGLAGFLYVGRFGTINVTAGSGPRAGGDRRGRRRRGEHARRLGDDHGRVPRRGADRRARPEPRAGRADQRVLARRDPRRADPPRRRCSTSASGAACGRAARSEAVDEFAAVRTMASWARRYTWELLLLAVLRRHDRLQPHPVERLRRRSTTSSTCSSCTSRRSSSSSR